MPEPGPEPDMSKLASSYPLSRTKNMHIGWARGSPRLSVLLALIIVNLHHQSGKCRGFLIKSREQFINLFTYKQPKVNSFIMFPIFVF